MDEDAAEGRERPTRLQRKLSLPVRPDVGPNARKRPYLVQTPYQEMGQQAPRIKQIPRQLRSLRCNRRPPTLWGRRHAVYVSA